mmetsp:Transcript_44265/g.64917  ORF Transcript_44265/g.64917 Transcript_44265/m.64917 type:complete len:318 (+) Transcript_44265:101-1054(+)
MHVQRRTTSQCVLITALLFLGLSSESICQQIEPHLYAKIFEVNKPAWVRLADLIKQNVPVSHEGPRVLDIGAGPGEPTATMARLLPTHTFVLTDKQEPMVEKAKVRTKDMTNIEFHVASAEDLSIFPSASFDAVTGCYVLMFVDLDKTLQEMARVLKPGALAFVTVLTSNSFYEIAHSSLHELYHSKSFKGVVPALGVNPLSLSATSQFGISSVETGVSSMIDKSLKIKTSEDLSYDIHLGDMHATCVATFVYGTPFADIAKEYGTTESELKTAYCAIVEDKIRAHADWEMPDASFRLGQVVAKLYTLQKTDTAHEL